MGRPPWTRPEDCASEFGRLRSHLSRRMFRFRCTTTSSDGGPFRSQGTARALSGQRPLRPGPSGPCAAREPVLLTQATDPLTSCLLLSPSLPVHQIQTFWDTEWTTGWRGVGRGGGGHLQVGGVRTRGRGCAGQAGTSVASAGQHEDTGAKGSGAAPGQGNVFVNLCLSSGYSENVFHRQLF